MHDKPPSHDIDQLTHAKAHRDAILATGKWITSTDVVARLNDRVLELTPDEYASRLRRDGRLFGVKFRGTYLHPEFQFDGSDQPNDALPRLLAELKPILDEDATGWSTAFWLFQRSRVLDGETPATVFPRNHERVISHARLMFSADGGW